MKSNSPLVILVFILLGTSLQAQPVLRTDEAVLVTLENNFGIRMGNNAINIAELNTSKANNGYYPTVDATLGPSASFGASTQNFSNGMVAETGYALTYGVGASVDANYVIYDQVRDKAYEQLSEFVALADLELRQTMENTVLQLYNQYYLVAQLTENVAVLENAVDLSKKRVERARIRYEYSQGLRIDVLNAQVDVSRDSVNLLNAKTELTNAKRDLNIIMGVDVNNDFVINKDVDYEPSLNKMILIEEALENNVQLLLIQQNKVINRMDIDILEAQKKPRIGTSAGISYAYQKNPSKSFFTSSTSNGLNLGINLGWNLFDGGQRAIQRDIVQVELNNLDLQKEQLLLSLIRDIENTWDAFQNALFVMKVEENNLVTSQLNLQRTEELFNAGQVTSVEFRQAQLNLMNNEMGYNNARFQAKAIELQLKYLAGRILSV